MNILFLDDDHRRHAWAKSKYPHDNIVHVFTVDEFKREMSSELWGIVHFDFDLFLDRNTPSGAQAHIGGYHSETHSGHLAAVAFAEMMHDKPHDDRPKIYIHSHNHGGALSMLFLFLTFGYQAIWHPYGAQWLYDQNARQIALAQWQGWKIR